MIIDMVYDDYGQYECDESQPAYQEFVRFIKEKAIKVEQGENPYHEKEFDPENPEHLEYEYLMEQVDKGRVQLKMMGNGCWYYPIVNKFPIHKRVFDECLQSPLDDFRGQITVENCCDRMKDVGQSQYDMVGILKKVLQEQVEDGKLTQEEYDEKMEDVGIRESEIQISGSMMGTNEYFYGQYNLTVAYKELGEELFWSSLGEVYMLYLWSMNLNKMITPVMSAGQEFGFEEKISFYDGVSKIANEIKTEWEEDY